MNRPASVDEETWRAFMGVYDAAPASRRTANIPTTNQQARDAIAGMTIAAWDAGRTIGGTTIVEHRVKGLKGEPPVFSDPEDFPEYWSTLRFYMRGQTVSNNLETCQTACFGILSKWQGKDLSELAKKIDAGDLARSTWKDTQESILTWLNKEFRSQTDYDDATRRWQNTPVKLKRRHFEKGLDFFLAFEVELASFNEACIRNSVDKPTEKEISRMFVNSLPPAIAARVRETAGDVSTVKYDTYKKKISNVFEAHRVAHIKINRVTTKRVRYDEDDDDEAERPTKVLAGNFSRFPKGSCRQSWDAAPPNLKGAIYPADWMNTVEEKEARLRYDRVKQANVCAHCRQKRQGHVQDTFETLKPFAQRVRATTMQEEIDEQLQEGFLEGTSAEEED